VCVAIPARVEWIGDRSAVSIPGRVRIGEAQIEVDFLLVAEVAVGDHVLVHSGYAISIVPETAADEVLTLLSARGPSTNALRPNSSARRPGEGPRWE
jgi:hydrogenase assembly chaperone HypC/HupF